MIKATAQFPDGRKVLILGLSDMNITKLREDNPIHIFGAEMGGGYPDVVIVWGTTEDEIRKKLAPLIKPETKITVGRPPAS
jgi:hypothetical protein